MQAKENVNIGNLH